MLNFNRFYIFQNKYSKIFLNIFIFLFCIILFIFSFNNVKKKGYFLFIEFSDAYGLKEGTSVNYKGVKVGSIQRISLHVNKVVVLLKIHSFKILIPRDVIFEANQIGLFNDTVVSINTSTFLTSNLYQGFMSCSNNSQASSFIIPNSYIKGYKGINYDDLIRSTTRISQRFDDPRFFSLLYLLLKNSIYISDEVLMLIYNSSIISNILIEFIPLVLTKYLL
uniref:Mce/MlaD domain-containing protein n=1 Tax=Vertebrata thuyoides TaxID=2006970 RepID=A0A1Z1MAQ7_9FLOR|nr:hypothetical protein [Vertebrata thuyoides]ARW63066.1 hypothetical protein [Vertebrata thuyoides]